MNPRAAAQHSALRSALALTISIALLLSVSTPEVIAVFAQGQSQSVREARSRPGKPEGDLPNLEEVKSESQREREAPPPIPSTVRSRKNPLQPWDGRRVGDPGTRGESGVNRTGRGSAAAHARRRMNPPAIYEDQFIQNFFAFALLRGTSNDETLFWNYQLRAAYGQGQVSLKLAAVELGKTLFESASYAARARDNHSFVYDLYKTYLMRDPDAGGWAYWEALVPGVGRESVRRGFEESTEFATLLGSIVPSGVAGANPASLITARVDPRNQPGNGMLARDATWNVPLLSLPGRNGLDLGLVLSYSSMVWTPSGPYLHFDEDNGFPSPGFRLGFPSVQRKVFDAQTAKNAFLLLTPGGRRVELRQKDTNLYEAADSSYLQLTDNSPNLVLRATDGTQLSFSESNHEFRCTQVKDRNGNYLTINHNAQGRISAITDTLGRLINFNYDSNANLISITQAWNGQPAHQWVSFGWSTRNMQYSFASDKVIGTAAGAAIPVITQVALNDTSYFTFDYSNSLQVSVIRNYLGAIERNAISFTYDAPAGDVPRLVDSRVSARNWTGINGVPSQVITQYSVAGDGACVMTAPDGTSYREYYGTGWQKGLTTRSEVRVGTEVRKWTTFAWTQDDTAVNYPLNPRITETNIEDGSNRRRTVIDYGPYAQYGLPYAVREYAADGVTEIRQTFTNYNLSQAYLERRIIGLVSQVHVSNVAHWQAKLSYIYDDPARLQAVPAAATQHDTNYHTSFTARGNVTAVSRWDVNDINNAAKKLTTQTSYYTTGTPISTTDAAGHISSIAYGDAFSDSVNRNTFAYPTTLTDADGFSSTVQYNFDFGATTRTQSPAPAGQTQGAIQTLTYNNLGQLERVTTTNNGAYKRFWYGPDYTASYGTVNNVADELYAIQVVDGMGRVIGAAGNHPGSSGGYRLVNTVYNQLGQAVKQSNPTEVNNSWVPVGDDSAGSNYTQQTYDWKGRPLVTTNPDGTTRQASYAGCGCAGGEVLTLTDELGHRQKLYSDVFGREAKMEVLNWNGTVYSTRTNAYNVRDQIETIKQYQGLESSGVYQQITKSYDGYGRVVNSKDPIQTTATVLTYTADDQPLTVTDARGVTQTFTYNGRDLPTTVSYSGGSALSPVTMNYDAAGNRISMADGTGSKTYQYNQLSRLTSETRQFNGLSGGFALSYEYNLGGALRAITDHTGSRVDYVYNTAGTLTTVNGSGTTSVPTYSSNISYRASGAIKDLDFGNGAHQHLTFNSRQQNTSLTLSKGSLNTNWGFDYYADGKIRKVTDSNDGVFDRAFDYDQVGRLQEARTGNEARGGTSPDGPFKQTYGYDVWENTTSRSFRLWNAVTQTESGNFTNNKRQNWFYDNDGNLTADFNANYGYDAAGRQNSFASNVHIGGWPTSYPEQSVLEISQTFDGNSSPAKKTTTNRLEEIVGEELHIQESTTTVYFLRSTPLGGQVVAELDETGYKRIGYIFAGGMRIASQYIWNPGYGFSIAWISTSPATGSEYMADIYLARKEFDPLGSDVTYASTSELVSEPIFYNPKFDQMPLMIEGGPSEEYKQANREWASAMATAFQAVQDRGTTEQLWQSGRRSEAMAILMKNPNVGIEYRAIYKNEVIRSGSWFGKDAADFLNGINIAVGAGWLTPLSAISDQQTRLDDAKADLMNRLGVNNGKNACADLFGGYDKAIDALNATKFSFMNLGAPLSATVGGEFINAGTKGKNVYINSQGAFMAVNGQVPTQLSLLANTDRPNERAFVTRAVVPGSFVEFRNDVKFASFLLLHELGHRRGIYGKDDKDGRDDKNGTRLEKTARNNKRILDACFKD